MAENDNDPLDWIDDDNWEPGHMQHILDRAHALKVKLQLVVRIPGARHFQERILAVSEELDKIEKQVIARGIAGMETNEYGGEQLNEDINLSLTEWPKPEGWPEDMETKDYDNLC